MTGFTSKRVAFVSVGFGAVCLILYLVTVRVDPENSWLIPLQTFGAVFLIFGVAEAVYWRLRH